MKPTKIEEEVTKDSIEYEEHKHQNYKKNQIKISKMILYNIKMI